VVKPPEVQWVQCRQRCSAVHVRVQQAAGVRAEALRGAFCLPVSRGEAPRCRPSPRAACAKRSERDGLRQEYECFLRGRDAFSIAHSVWEAPLFRGGEERFARPPSILRLPDALSCLSLFQPHLSGVRGGRGEVWCEISSFPGVHAEPPLLSRLPRPPSPEVAHAPSHRPFLRRPRQEVF